MTHPSHDPETLRPAEPPRDGPDAGPGDAARPGIEQLGDIVREGVAVLDRQRRGFFFAGGGLAVLLLAAIALQTPVYESTSLLLVKFGRELVYQPEVGADQTFAPRDKASVINSELAIVRSRPVLQGAVRAVGLEAVYPDLAAMLPPADDEAGAAAGEGTAEGSDESPEAQLVYAEAAERLQAAVTAQALPETDVLEIGFQHPDPIVAARTVNALVDRFLEAHLTAFGEPEVVAFLEQRVAEYQARLDESEQALLEFEKEHAAFALENPQSILLQWRDEARAELENVEAQMAAIRLRHLQEDATVSEARNTLLRLQMEATTVEGQLRRDTQEQIRVVQRFIANRKEEMNEELASLQTKKDALQKQLTVTSRELSELPALSVRYRSLRRQRDADEEQYGTYSRRLRDARLSTEMDREKLASINVIQMASPSPRPVWPPRKSLSVPVALVLALGAGVLCAIALDRIGPTGIAWLDGEQRAHG